MSEGLHDIRVLVTRPKGSSQALAVMIEDEDGIAVRLPLLEIEQSVDAESRQRCQFISGYDWVIFISQNAVRHALALLPSNKWMDNTAIAAIGNGTTSALRQAGFPVDLQPNERMSSEGLLQALDDKSLVDQKILIIRGVGGREVLAKGLRERKALVDYAEIYSRCCPEINIEQLSQILKEGLDVITIASGETLQNLASMIKLEAITKSQQQQIRSCPLVVVSKRIKLLAIELGFTSTIIVAKQPDNMGIVKAIQQWRSGDNE